jgi:hypothetical protein
MGAGHAIAKTHAFSSGLNEEQQAEVGRIISALWDDADAIALAGIRSVAARR